VSFCICAAADSVGEDCCSDDIWAVGIVEDCMAPDGDAGIDDDEDEEEEDAWTMRFNKDSQKAAVHVSSRRNRAASKTRLHVSTFASGDSDT
jgi:hypothetical protein